MHLCECLKLPWCIVCVQGGHAPSNGNKSEKKSSSSYDIGELATSSLMGETCLD